MAISRRQLIAGAGAAAAVAAGAAVVSRRDEGTTSATSTSSTTPTTIAPPTTTTTTVPTTTTTLPPMTEVRLGPDPVANLLALQTAAATGAVRVVGEGPIGAPWNVHHACGLIDLQGHLHLPGGAPVIERTGVLGPVVPGPTAGAPGEWVLTVSEDPVAASGKQTRGYLRRNGEDRPFPRTMTSPRSMVAALAPPLVLMGTGRISHSRPELDEFNELVSFRVCEQPQVLDVEITSGGYSGVVFYITNGAHCAANIHDLLDDYNGTGWRREGAPDVMVPNPNGLRHFGYGVDLMGANRDVTIRGPAIHHVRHAVTTQQPSEHQRRGIGGDDAVLGVAGETEGVDCSVDVDSCWSANISPHEIGLDLWFHDMRSTNPGLYQNRFGSRSNEENADHFNLRAPSRLEHVTMRGGERSVGVADNPRLAHDLPLTVDLTDVVIEDVAKGIQVKTSMTFDDVTVRRASDIGLHIQGGTVDGEPTFEDCARDVVEDDGR